MNEVDVVSRPILFSAPMVQALLEGRKTQTRRVLKQEPEQCGLPIGTMCIEGEANNKVTVGNVITNQRCPYGKVGDLLWVRENFAFNKEFDKYKPREVDDDESVKYMADGEWIHRSDYYVINLGKTRPNIFMPKWASRITLEITNIRVERLQDVSESDANAESDITPEIAYAQNGVRAGALNYGALWEEINGEGSWDKNPWVWVLEFEVYKCNFQELL